MRCGICNHARRAEIEAAASVGGPGALLDAAKRFGVSRASLATHVNAHVTGEAAVGRASTVTSPAGVAGSSPETSTAPTVLSAGAPISARDVTEDIVRRVDALLRKAEQDEEATHRERAALATAATQAAKLLASLTGENATEANLAGSAQYKRVLLAVSTALKPYPEAAAAVTAALSDMSEAA